MSLQIAGQDPSSNLRRTENTVRSTEVSRTKASEEVENSHEVSTSDRVELSSQARTIQRAREIAQEAPEVREDRVEQARQALQNGSLKLQGSDLADTLLRDTLPR
ncbi:MAG: flagellar biosynthesis anti-sigma factor FlgM [Candidatus Tectimicrobiota bacterium]